MSQNDGVLGQSSEIGITKATFSVGSAGNLVGPVLVPPGPNNVGAGVTGAGTAGAPGLGQPGHLVQVPPNLIYPPALSRMSVQFMGTSDVADAAKTVAFVLFVQRNTLQNGPMVMTEAAIPEYAPPPLAPVPVPMASSSDGLFDAQASVAALPGSLPTQASVDFSATPWIVQPGDVYYVLAIFSTPLSAGSNLTNVMVSLG